MSGVRAFERRQTGPVGGEEASFHRDKEKEATRSGELAFRMAMITARRQGLEKFTVGAVTTPGTERPRFVMPETIGRVRSSSAFD